jgi:hypothetical protein
LIVQMRRPSSDRTTLARRWGNGSTPGDPNNQNPHSRPKRLDAPCTRRQEISMASVPLLIGPLLPAKIVHVILTGIADSCGISYAFESIQRIILNNTTATIMVRFLLRILSDMPTLSWPYNPLICVAKQLENCLEFDSYRPC